MHIHPPVKFTEKYSLIWYVKELINNSSIPFVFLDIKMNKRKCLPVLRIEGYFKSSMAKKLNKNKDRDNKAKSIVGCANEKCAVYWVYLAHDTIASDENWR